MPPEKNLQTPALLGVTEFAALLGVHRITLWQWLKAYPDKMPRPFAFSPGKKENRRRRYFLRSDVEKWLAGNHSMTEGRAI